MNRRIAFPFLTLSDSAIEARPWLIALDAGDPEKAGEFLAHWDRSTKLTLQRTLRVNLDVAAVDLGIPLEALRLAVVTRIGTGSGKLPRLIVHTDRRDVCQRKPEARIHLQVEGERLSTVLDLFTEVVLASAPAEFGQLSPKHVGDRLWCRRQRTRLEGEEPRFPLEVVNLRDILGDVPAAAAPWYLHWSPHDWARDFYGAMRLFLNSNCEEVVVRVESRDPLTLQAILADVMSQVCERLLAESEPDAVIAQCEPGSLAAQAGQWLKLAWPGHDAAFARAMLVDRPREFRATLLAVAKVED